MWVTTQATGLPWSKQMEEDFLLIQETKNNHQLIPFNSLSSLSHDTPEMVVSLQGLINDQNFPNSL